MRLSRPLLTSADVLTSDSWDLPGQLNSTLPDSLQDEFTQQISLAGTSLILPQSFGYYSCFKHIRTSNIPVVYNFFAKCIPIQDHLSWRNLSELFESSKCWVTASFQCDC